MNKDAEEEARPRPLSAGIWTLFSWLRREDRSSSSESLSSAGSDRTVASFAFLPPTHYETTNPLILPPPGPPTDSYKKRVHDRNLRRQFDRDLTLHRKYGLLKSEGGCSYDAFSLPPIVRKGDVDCSSKWDRERRANSECLQRRVVHVPGKRRAPAPPGSGSSTSLPRRHTRKRPAPQPPGANKENHQNIHVINTIVTQMNGHPIPDSKKLVHNDVNMGCKSEKYSKKDIVKDTKIRREKSFLKQIFDNRKRNSAIDTSSIKILPSISELDKQAAEIIETSKTKPKENKTVKNDQETKDMNYIDMPWICVSCLRKYNSSQVSCHYCLPDKGPQAVDSTNKYDKINYKGFNESTQTETDISKSSSSSKKTSTEEKQKLKEMLKEMKDSLPKRHKNDANKHCNPSAKTLLKSTETPTLRVGSPIEQTTKSEKTTLQLTSQPSSSNVHMIKPVVANAATVIQDVTSHTSDKKINTTNVGNKQVIKKDPATNIPVKHQGFFNDGKVKLPDITTKNQILGTPLKISSLLNPVYVQKKSATQSDSDIVHRIQKNQTEVLTAKSSNKISQNVIVPTSSNESSCSSILPEHTNAIKSNERMDHHNNTSVVKVKVPEIVATSKDHAKGLSSTEIQDQHSKRRHLINQLEQSIAKGDERAAAEAAAKLAQLRLSCSVLSFSSQILAQATTSSKSEENENFKPSPMRNKLDVNKIIETKINTSQGVSSGIGNSTVIVTSPQIKPVNEVKKNSSTTTNAVIQQAPQSSSFKLINVTEDHNKEKTVLPVATTSKNDQNKISISVLVEDREATRGPVHLRIDRQANVKDLRLEAASSLGLATNLQRWIIGRTLCADDTASVASLAGPDFSAPFYLCLVESETKINTISRTKVIDATKDNSNQKHINGGNVYTELVQLEQQALVPNPEHFECEVCMEEYAPGRGVVLRECVHIFCRDCLSDVVRHSEEPNVPCPAMGCPGMLQEREIRAIVSSEEYERWLARGLAMAESGTRNAFHCRTKDCTGWALCETGVQKFPCPVCKRINCVPCQAIHEATSCEEYQLKCKEAASKNTIENQDDEGTRTLLNSLIKKGEALECPECKAIITKKWGCDWVKCSACKTEICWVTRGRRWGPGGKGDTSGGCRCGVDGKKCHPSCGYCH